MNQKSNPLKARLQFRKIIPLFSNAWQDWGNFRGQWKLSLLWSGVRASDVVFVSIGEGTAGGPNAFKFIGRARYTLHNVAMRAGRIDIWVNIEWGSNIRLYVHYLVVRR